MLVFLLIHLSVISCKKEVVAPTETNSDMHDKSRMLDKVIIDASIVDNLDRLKDYKYCYDHYPEILYLVQKKYPGSAHAAFQAAYQLAVTDGNFEAEIENLVTQAFYLSTSEMESWNHLDNKEKKMLLTWLDKLQPMDWISVKDSYSAGVDRR